MRIDPHIGFTSDVIKDPRRFVGRTELINSCWKILQSPSSLIAVYGKRGVGKSSLMRQIQLLATGNYGLLKQAGLYHLVTERSRKYLTVYYTCDSNIDGLTSLTSRLCNAQDQLDSLLRLVPDDGKEVTEFSRSSEVSGGFDLKLVSAGVKGLESTKYAKVVPNDIVQTFRNFIDSVVEHQVKRLKREGLLIILDEFDTIKSKEGIGSLIKSISNPYVKFAICGVASGINELVADHASVERLLENGAIHVGKMQEYEVQQIFSTAQTLFDNKIQFNADVVNNIAQISDGYPYFAQMIGKECIEVCNDLSSFVVDKDIIATVLKKIQCGQAFPTLETAYQRAIGETEDRRLLLHILAEQTDDKSLFTDELGKIILRDARVLAKELGIEFVDQLLPRLIDPKYGPVLLKSAERNGVYEFVNPVFRLYVRLRSMD